VKTKVLSKKQYEKELGRLQLELVRLQEWIVQEGLKVVVLFEGRDTAGKGGNIRRITERTNPRVVRSVALGTPSDRERSQWYFQRYVAHLPAAGEMVLFDRSWYNRAGVERVMGYCTDAEYEEFMRTCPQFERIIQGSGVVLLKYWLSVSDEEQERRFMARLEDPEKRWKLSPTDIEARARWVDYAEAKDEMFAFTDTRDSPWFVVEADDKRTARLNLISHLLEQIPYEEIDHEKVAPTCARRSSPRASSRSASGSSRRLPKRDQPRQGVAAEVEDPLEVAADEEPVGERAEWAEGDRVADAVVDHGRALAVPLEAMGVLPERVGTLLLMVDEAERRLPRVDPGAPAQRHSVQPEPVLEQRSRLHPHRARRGHLEMEPGRGHRLQVAVVAVEGERLLDRQLDPLAALEEVGAHGPSFAARCVGPSVGG